VLYQLSYLGGISTEKTNSEAREFYLPGMGMSRKDMLFQGRWRNPSGPFWFFPVVFYESYRYRFPPFCREIRRKTKFIEPGLHFIFL
jgi:hypothetical protein